jgi:hypothetical protein
MIMLQTSLIALISSSDTPPHGITRLAWPRSLTSNTSLKMSLVGGLPELSPTISLYQIKYRLLITSMEITLKIEL